MHKLTVLTATCENYLSMCHSVGANDHFVGVVPQLQLEGRRTTNRGETVATWGFASVYTSCLYTRYFSVTSAYRILSTSVYTSRVYTGILSETSAYRILSASVYTSHVYTGILSVTSAQHILCASEYTSHVYTGILSVTSAHHILSASWVYLPLVHRSSQWPVPTVFCLLLCIPPTCKKEIPVSTVFCQVILLVCDVYMYTGLPFPSQCQTPTLSVQTEVSECFVHGDFQSATSEEGQTMAE